MRPYMMHMPLFKRLFNGYLTADLSYVLFTKRFDKPATDAAGQHAQMAYFQGGTMLNWASWQTASLTGIALAHSIPTTWGLGFAGILALAGVASSLASSTLRRVSAVVAGAAAVAAFALPFKLNIVVAIAAAVALTMLLENMSPTDKNKGVS